MNKKLFILLISAGLPVFGCSLDTRVPVLNTIRELSGSCGKTKFDTNMTLRKSSRNELAKILILANLNAVNSNSYRSVSNVDLQLHSISKHGPPASGVPYIPVLSGKGFNNGKNGSIWHSIDRIHTQRK